MLEQYCCLPTHSLAISSLSVKLLSHPGHLSGGCTGLSIMKVFHLSAERLKEEWREVKLGGCKLTAAPVQSTQLSPPVPIGYHW